MISQPTTVVNRMKVLDSSSSFPIELSSAYDMRIAIIDLDDNEPEFGRFVISRNVSDSLKVGETIDLDPTVAFIPNANDRDFLEANKNISYFIVSGNEEGKFSLNRFTGELKLVEEFERSLRDIYRLGIIFFLKNITLKFNVLDYFLRVLLLLKISRMTITLIDYFLHFLSITMIDYFSLLIGYF